MMDAVKNPPPLAVQDYVQRHFKGQLIRASGVARSLDDFGARYATATFEDDSGVSVSANFTKSLGAEVKLISTGDKIGVVGQVFNVSARMVVLDECKFSEVKQREYCTLDTMGGRNIFSGNRNTHDWNCQFV